MRLLLVLTLFIGSQLRAQVETCETMTHSQNLQLVYPAASTLQHPVQVQFRIEEEFLKITFEVQAKVINAKPVFSSDDYPYKFDVVEIFFSVSPTRFPYYELEVSPLDQVFQVRVNALDKPFINNIETGFLHQTRRTEFGWQAELQIPLKNLNWNGDIKSIIGNVYAIQGKSPARSFWSLSAIPKAKPNFHQPQFFKSFFKCE